MIKVASTVAKKERFNPKDPYMLSSRNKKLKIEIKLQKKCTSKERFFFSSLFQGKLRKLSGSVGRRKRKWFFSI